jgi:hypothetical protein
MNSLYRSDERELFTTSSFGLGLGIHDSGVLRIASSLDEQNQLGIHDERTSKYLDVDKVFEKFSLA